MRSFNDYHQAYLKIYPVSNIKSSFLPAKKKIAFTINDLIINLYKIYEKILFIFLSTIKSYKTWILLTPIIFTFLLNSILFKINNGFFLLKSDEKIITSSLKKYKTLSLSLGDKTDSKKTIQNQVKSLKSVKLLDNKLIKLKKPIVNENKNLALASSYNWEKNFSSKKIIFIKTLLPIISFENQKILIDRNKLIEIKKYIKSKKTLKIKDILYLDTISKKYLIKTNNKHKIDLIEELLISVNIIPNSIVLAQAANESGWGSSRFAKEHNALFGEYTYDKKIGVIPYEREIGKKHMIRNFSSIDKSVESYFKNINTHYAYQRFRDLRNKNNIYDSNNSIKTLTQALDVYAEDESYVRTLNAIIDSNKLTQFDKINFSIINS